MRRVAAGIAMSVIVILAMGLASAWPDEGTSLGRFQQHLVARGPDEGCDCDGSELCTHLPLVMIETGGAQIPGLATGEHYANGSDIYALASDGRDVIDASVSVVDHDDSNNHPSDEPTLESHITIRYRGNSSRKFDKHSYLFRTTQDDGITKNDVEMLGMDAFDEWALHGPYLDKSLLRNYMWYNIAGQIMDYAPNVRYCELILNGEYQGLYLMVETIGSGTDARLDLTQNEDNSTEVSYVLRLDRGSTNELRNLTTFTNMSLRNLLTYDVVFPGTKNLTDERLTYIEEDVSEFEKALFSYDYDTEPYAYWNYIDVDSFVNYFLINEVAGNYDAGSYSTYIYRDIRGKYKMCVWDFNNTCENFMEEERGHTSLQLQNRLIYTMLTKDEEFDQAIVDRYRELRQTYFDPEYLNSYIDEVIDYLGPAIDRNFEVWGYTFDASQLADDQRLDPVERNPVSFQDAVSQLRNFINLRIEWLDENIDCILQYGHASKVKNFNH